MLRAIPLPLCPDDTVREMVALISRLKARIAQAQPKDAPLLTARLAVHLFILHKILPRG